MNRYISKRRTFYNMLALFILYINITLAFSVLYCALELTGFGNITDHYAAPSHQSQPFDLVTRSFYFSSITLLSVGYGDITPFGWARAAAIVEAMIGYILPAALVIKYFQLPQYDATHAPVEKRAQSDNVPL
jgi:potassium channel LctB